MSVIKEEPGVDFRDYCSLNRWVSGADIVVKWLTFYLCHESKLLCFNFHNVRAL